MKNTKKFDKRFGRPTPVAMALKKWSRKIPGKMVLLVRLRKEWQNILHDQIGIHSWPHSIRNGELRINVDDNIWLQELSLMKDEIYTTIRAYIRDDNFPKLIKRLRFQNGEVKHQKVKTEDLVLYLDKATEEHILEQTASVKDPELREALNHYFIQCSLIPLQKEYAQRLKEENEISQIKKQ